MSYEESEKPYVIHDELSGGLEWGFKSQEESTERLKECIIDHRDYAVENEEWAPEVNSVCGMLVTHILKEKEYQYEGEDRPCYDYEFEPTAEWSRIQEQLSELERVADQLSDVWLYLDAWARSESVTIEDVKALCETLLKKQQAPGWKPVVKESLSTRKDGE